MPHGGSKTIQGFLLQGRMPVDGLDKGRRGLVQLVLLLPFAVLLFPQAAQALCQMVEAGGQRESLVLVAAQTLRPGKLEFVQAQRRAGA